MAERARKLVRVPGIAGDVVVGQKTLLAAISGMPRIANKRHPPILADILLVAEDGRLTLTGTDLYVSLRCTVDATVRRPFRTTVAAKELLDLVKAFSPDADVALTFDDSRGKLRVRSKKAQFAFPVQPFSDFPRLPEPPSAKDFLVEGETLLDMIKATEFAMLRGVGEEQRPQMAGIYVEVGQGTVRMATTDGHRLALIVGAADEDKAAVSEILPRKCVAELRHLIGEGETIGVSVDNGHAFFESPRGFVLSSKLTDATFPAYKKVIPEVGRQRCLVPRVPLIEALTRAMLVSNELTGAVVFAFGHTPGTLRISSENTGGEGFEDLDIAYEGERVDVVFNGGYVLNALQASPGDEVEFDIGDALDSGVVRPSPQTPTPYEMLHVIMPLRT